MFRLFSNSFQDILKSPPDSNDSGAAVVDEKPLSKEDTIEFLGEEDETPETLEITKEKEVDDDSDEEETKESKKRTETDEDDLTELEKEIDGPTDEQLELVTPVARREILKKYPTLFKDFPYLEKAYYREQQFTELLPTIDDAKQAVAKSETLDKFEADLLKGNTEVILKSIKNADERSWNRIVDEYLPTLSRVDPPAYHHVIGNIIRHTIVSMVNESRTSQNEALQAAALLLNQFVFGTSDFRNPTKLSTEEPQNREPDRVAEREREFTRRQFESTRGELNQKVNNILKSTIDANLDPRNSMTEYVKKNASRETIETLTDLIDKDSRFRLILDKLWEGAFRTNFDKQSVDKIKSAYLSKAKTLLPSVIKKARNEALKGMGKRTKSDRDDDSNDESIVEKKSQSPAPKKGPKSAIPAGMKSIDYLMQD
jgi:hypothetical protein